MKVQFKKAAQKGFSLVELLVVIAVIGIMAAIAIPMISNINKNATDAKDRRNAQQIASVYGAAIAAGAPDFQTTAGNAAALDTIITALAGGAVKGAEPFADSYFKIDLNPTEATAAKKYLSISGSNPPIITYSGVKNSD